MRDIHSRGCSTTGDKDGSVFPGHRGNTSDSEDAMRLLLITGGFHPYHLTTPVNTRTLRKGGHTVRVTRSAKELTEPSSVWV